MGVIAAYNDGTIESCNVVKTSAVSSAAVTLQGNGSVIGGIVGTNTGTVSGCAMNVNYHFVTASDKDLTVGGAIGKNEWQSADGRQYVKNVFGTNWLPYVSSYYGYRVHPISGVKNYHTGIDIAMPSGTEILAGHDGTVTLAGEAGGYGLCVAIDGVAYKDHTLTTKYGHCSQVLVSVGQAVKAGDVIARVGSTGNSTGPHLHLEVLVDGQYLNPLYFAETGDTGSVGLPTAAGGGGSYISYDVPPEALADEQFAAMLAEAEKYLGYPYVWGGSSPSTSFDCSGYVSWVINHSGWNMGRLTAQGLLDACTPVTAANAKPGDLIFFQGTYDTSGASHVGIYVGGGMMIHCGNPISYASIETKYWTEHFYCFGRLP